jgi:hypothetical protein
MPLLPPEIESYPPDCQARNVGFRVVCPVAAGMAE